MLLFVFALACRRDAETSIAPDPPVAKKAAPKASANAQVAIDVPRLEAFGVLSSDVVRELEASGCKVIETRDDPAAHALYLDVVIKTEPSAILKIVIATRSGAPVRVEDVAIVRAK